MSISVTLNPGNRQFYNNVWYVGGQNVIVDNATAATWIIANIADVSPNQPTGLVENFPSQAAFNASLTAGVAAVGISKEGLQFNNGLKTRSIVDALRVSIVSGINRFKSKNPYENGPIIASAAWQATTAYTAVGQIVQSSNGGVAYDYWLFTTGTSGSTALATLTGAQGNAPITDGTAVWYLLGISKPADLTKIGTAPTVTFTTAAASGLANTLNVTAGSGTSATFNGGSLFTSGGFPIYISFGFGFPVLNNGVGNNGNVPGAPPRYITYSALYPTISFYSDAPSIFIYGGNSYSTSSGFAIEVDGQFLQPGVLVPTAATGGLLIAWGTRKPRRYKLFWPPNVPFDGIKIDAGSNVWAENNSNRYRIAIQGDSLTGGAAGIPSQAMDWPTILGYYAGCDDVWNFAAGGTGFTLGSSLGSVNATAFVAGTFYKINNLGTTNWLSVGWTAANSQQLTGAPAIGDYFYASGPDTAGGTGAANACSLPYLGRLPDIIACNPDLHIIAGSTNDISANQTFRRNAMLAYLQAFRAQSSAPILFFGSIPGSTLSSALITMEQDAQWAIGQMNDETIYFIPTSQDPSPWVNGTGNVGATTGVGNSDVYTLPAGTHPTPNGVIYRAMRYVNAFNAWINSL